MKKKRVEYAVQFKMRASDGRIGRWMDGVGYESTRDAWAFFTAWFLSLTERINKGLTAQRIVMTRMIRRTIIEEVVR